MLKKTLFCMLAAAFALPSLAHADASGGSNDTALIKRGEYLATAGDCMACHTTAQGRPFAGGLPLKVPMLGTIYSSNITPDPETGIGNWTLADFDGALRRGVSKDGHNLYPAMPYVSYAKISDDDVKALFAYFRYGVAPVKQATRQSDIPWPLNMRWPLKAWNAMFLKSGPYQDKSNQSVEWNRGAYLVQGLAHCSTCHTPRGFAMQEVALDESGSGFLSGSVLAGWEGYNVTSSLNSGIGTWTPEQLKQYLQTGHVQGLGGAAGPMGEAVEHSFSKMTDADVTAIAAYVRTVPAVEDGSKQPRGSLGKPATDVTRLRGVAMSEGSIDPARLFLGNCASCHQAVGKGTPDGYYPPLMHNTTVGASNPNNLMQVILHGVHRSTSNSDVGMPGFAVQLSNDQIAALTNYVTTQFGNPASTRVSAQDVAKLR
ncbi:Cytochrome c, mono-and diheme variants [Paraburkholderia fungorum]|uniref:Cytochrome c, mono-and diheme variants n=1 Tax=Paraburkholderia fungorum TaxID=134537 RepID=A0A1H1I065_9BURK|nr:cytochrome c [Paraburkholderia fungorum]SDR30969.1 Cytochrome c, mono-and diheme variants [Paraburkholderia fungorum]